MNKEIENLIKKSTLRDVELKILEAKTRGEIIPDNVITILRELEIQFNKELKNEK